MSQASMIFPSEFSRSYFASTVFGLFAVLQVHSALGQSNAQLILKEEANIPQNTTQGPSLGARGMPEVIQCSRDFTWKGRRYPCDSFFRRDAEGLRAVIAEVPEALEILSQYQRTRRNVRIAAFTATGGVAVAGVAFAASRAFYPNGGNDATLVRNVGIGIGLVVVVTSFVSAFVLQQINEARLNRLAVTYNSAKPDTPIGLEFTTEFDLK